MHTELKKPRKAHVRLSKEQRGEAVIRYLSGEKMEAICAQFNIGHSYLSMAVKRLGLPKRVWRAVCPHCHKPLTGAVHAQEPVA